MLLQLHRQYKKRTIYTLLRTCKCQNDDKKLSGDLKSRDLFFLVEKKKKKKEAVKEHEQGERYFDQFFISDVEIMFKHGFWDLPELSIAVL